MKKFFLSISFCSLVIIFISSCKKGTSFVPYITINSPADGSTYKLGTPIPVSELLIDSLRISSATIEVRNSVDTVVFAHNFPEAFGKDTFTLSYTYLSTATGTYKLVTTTTDYNSNLNSKTIDFTVN